VSLDRILKSPIFAFFITCSDVEAWLSGECSVNLIGTLHFFHSFGLHGVISHNLSLVHPSFLLLRLSAVELLCWTFGFHYCILPLNDLLVLKKFLNLFVVGLSFFIHCSPYLSELLFKGFLNSLFGKLPITILLVISYIFFLFFYLECISQFLHYFVLCVSFCTVDKRATSTSLGKLFLDSSCSSRISQTRDSESKLFVFALSIVFVLIDFPEIIVRSVSVAFKEAG
jgi:hypothetical protein